MLMGLPSASRRGRVQQAAVGPLGWVLGSGVGPRVPLGGIGGVCRTGRETLRAGIQRTQHHGGAVLSMRARLCRAQGRTRQARTRHVACGVRAAACAMPAYLALRGRRWPGSFRWGSQPGTPDFFARLQPPDSTEIKHARDNWSSWHATSVPGMPFEPNTRDWLCECFRPRHTCDRAGRRCE